MLCVSWVDFLLVCIKLAIVSSSFVGLEVHCEYRNFVCTQCFLGEAYVVVGEVCILRE